MVIPCNMCMFHSKFCVNSISCLYLCKPTLTIKLLKKFTQTKTYFAICFWCNKNLSFSVRIIELEFLLLVIYIGGISLAGKVVECVCILYRRALLYSIAHLGLTDGRVDWNKEIEIVFISLSIQFYAKKQSYFMGNINWCRGEFFILPAKSFP